MSSTMSSMQLSQFCKDFSTWYPFNDTSIQKAPKQPGAYVFRKAGGKRFGRLSGESDIMYIGSTEAKGGLKQRLGQYLHPGPTQWTNKRIKEFSKKHEMEIAWCPCGEPGNLEHQLLQKYLEEHDELPPLNYASKRLLKKVLKEELTVTDRCTPTRS